LLNIAFPLFDFRWCRSGSDKHAIDKSRIKKHMVELISSVDVAIPGRRLSGKGDKYFHVSCTTTNGTVPDLSENGDMDINR